MISQRFKWYWVKLMKKSKLCIRFSQPHDFANGPDLIAQWRNRPAKLPWNPITKIRTYRYHAWNKLFQNEYSVTNYYDSIEISFYSNLWSSRLSQQGAAERDSETQQILRGEYEIPGSRYGEDGVIFFYWTKYDSTGKGSEQITWIKNFSRVSLSPSNCTVPLAAPGVCSSILSVVLAHEAS